MSAGAAARAKASAETLRTAASACPSTRRAAPMSAGSGPDTVSAQAWSPLAMTRPSRSERKAGVPEWPARAHPSAAAGPSPPVRIRFPRLGGSGESCPIDPSQPQQRLPPNSKPGLRLDQTPQGSGRNRAPQLSQTGRCLNPDVQVRIFDLGRNRRRQQGVVVGAERAKCIDPDPGILIVHGAGQKAGHGRGRELGSLGILSSQYSGYRRPGFRIVGAQSIHQMIACLRRTEPSQ